MPSCNSTNGLPQGVERNTYTKLKTSTPRPVDPPFRKPRYTRYITIQQTHPNICRLLMIAVPLASAGVAQPGQHWLLAMGFLMLDAGWFQSCPLLFQTMVQSSSWVPETLDWVSTHSALMEATTHLPKGSSETRSDASFQPELGLDQQTTRAVVENKTIEDDDDNNQENCDGPMVSLLCRFVFQNYHIYEIQTNKHSECWWHPEIDALWINLWSICFVTIAWWNWTGHVGSGRHCESRSGRRRRQPGRYRFLPFVTFCGALFGLTKWNFSGGVVPFVLSNSPMFFWVCLNFIMVKQKKKLKSSYVIFTSWSSCCCFTHV